MCLVLVRRLGRASEAEVSPLDRADSSPVPRHLLLNKGDEPVSAAGSLRPSQRKGPGSSGVLAEPRLVVTQEQV